MLVSHSGRTVKPFVTFDVLVACHRDSVQSGSVQSGFLFAHSFDTVKRSSLYGWNYNVTYMLHTHILLRLSLEFYMFLACTFPFGLGLYISYVLLDTPPLVVGVLGIQFHA